MGTVSAWGEQFAKDCGSQLWSSSSQATAGWPSVADGRTANITGEPEVVMSPTDETEETVSPRGGSGGSANAVLAPPPPSTPVSAAGTPRFNANGR